MQIRVSMTPLVLLAEEDLVMRDQLARALRGRGYQVITVRDGLGLCDYLEYARFSHGRAPNPDLIVADAELAGYDGALICEQLSHEQAHIPFILLGQLSQNGGLGAVRVVEKPVMLELLLHAVAGCLGGAEVVSYP